MKGNTTQNSLRPKEINWLIWIESSGRHLTSNISGFMVSDKASGSSLLPFLCSTFCGGYFLREFLSLLKVTKWQPAISGFYSQSTSPTVEFEVLDLTLPVMNWTIWSVLNRSLKPRGWCTFIDYTQVTRCLWYPVIVSLIQILWAESRRGKFCTKKSGFH